MPYLRASFTIKKFYQCKDLDRRNLSDSVFFTEYLNRNKTFNLEGSSFAFSRKIVELLHYERKNTNRSCDWVGNVARTFGLKAYKSKDFCRIGKKSRPSVCPQNRPRADSLHRMAMAFARSADLQAFNSKLRKDPEGYDYARDYRYLREVCDAEKTAYEDRRKVAESSIRKSLIKTKYK